MIEELLFFPKITSLSKEILPFQDEFSNQYLHLHTNSIPFPSPQKREIKNFKTRQQISRKIHLHPPQKLLEHRPRTRELKAILSQDPLNAPLSLSLSLSSTCSSNQRPNRRSVFQRTVWSSSGKMRKRCRRFSKAEEDVRSPKQETRAALMEFDPVFGMPRSCHPEYGETPRGELV